MLALHRHRAERIAGNFGCDWWDPEMGSWNEAIACRLPHARQEGSGPGQRGAKHTRGNGILWFAI